MNISQPFPTNIPKNNRNNNSYPCSSPYQTSWASNVRTISASSTLPLRILIAIISATFVNNPRSHPELPQCWGQPRNSPSSVSSSQTRIELLRARSLNTNVISVRVHVRVRPGRPPFSLHELSAAALLHTDERARVSPRRALSRIHIYTRVSLGRRNECSS